MSEQTLLSKAECEREQTNFKGVAGEVNVLGLLSTIAELRAQLETLLGRIEDQTLVRNIQDDHKSDWAMRMAKFVAELAAARRALE